ncbi:MAG: MFS transporter [Chloroflexota bacterium]|nr:MFS transporter [Chloroflexota bacterium]
MTFFKPHNYVILGSLFWWFSLYIYVPVLPIYSKDLGSSLQFIGIIVGSYALGQILFRIPIGYLSDRLKSRKLFSVLSGIVSFLGSLYLFISNSPNDVLIGRTITGVAAAGWVAISVYYSSFFPRNERFKSSTIILSSNMLSVFLGTFLSGYISDLISIKTCFLLSMVAAILSSILFLFSKEKPFDAKSQFSTIQFINLLRNKLLICLCLIGILIQFITFSINFSYFPIYLNELSFSDSIVGNLVAFYTLASFIGTISSPKLIKRFGLWKIFIYSAILIGLTTLITPLFENLFLLIFLRLIGGIGGGIIFSSCMSSIVRGFQENYQASAMGIFQAVYAIGMFLGPILSGVIGSNINLESVFIFSSFVTLPIILISFFIKKEELAK